MSKIEVDQVDPQSGTTLTLGTSGDTVSIPSGVTLANAGTVTGIPTSALTGTIALNQMATGTDGNIISYDASGNPVAVATGSAGQVLTSAGAGAPPTFAAASGESNTPAFLAYANADQSGISGNTYTKITNYGVEVFDTDNKFASGSTFTPGVVGKYFVFATVYGQTNNTYRSFLALFLNGSNYVASANTTGSSENFPQQVSSIVDVTNTSDYIEVYYNNTYTGGTTTAYSSGVEVKFGAFRIIT
jgi:hypothetical protein